MPEKEHRNRGETLSEEEDKETKGTPLPPIDPDDENTTIPSYDEDTIIVQPFLTQEQPRGEEEDT